MTAATISFVLRNQNIINNQYFMTVVVRFQLIFLMKIKYISFRDLSPIRPFQELFQTRAGFIFLSDSPSTRLGLGHITFVCIFLSLLRKIWIISLLSFAP